MTGSRAIEPGRLAELVDGAPARDADERELAALLSATRALEQGAPERLRARVGARVRAADAAPAGPLARLRARLGSTDGRGRRIALVGAPVAAALVALAVAVPILTSDDASQPSAPPEGAVQRDAAPAEAAPAPADSGAAADSAATPPVLGVAPVPAPERGRAQRVTSWTRVRVDGVDALSRASARAMASVRGLGGFTAASDYDVPSGARGENRLVFRVPVARAQDAIAAFGSLGTVIGQRADIADVTARLDAGARAVTTLAGRVEELRAEAAASPGDAGVRARLERAEAELRVAERRRDAIRRSASLATLTLTLTTEGPPAAPADEGRFGGPLSRAGDRLADAAAWLLGALVLVGPFLIVGAGAAWATSRLRRRGARRLMGEA